jgi:hypothetical protein
MSQPANWLVAALPLLGRAAACRARLPTCARRSDVVRRYLRTVHRDRGATGDLLHIAGLAFANFGAADAASKTVRAGVATLVFAATARHAPLLQHITNPAALGRSTIGVFAALGATRELGGSANTLLAGHRHSRIAALPFCDPAGPCQTNTHSALLRQRARCTKRRAAINMKRTARAPSSNNNPAAALADSLRHPSKASSSVDSEVQIGIQLHTLATWRFWNATGRAHHGLPTNVTELTRRALSVAAARLGTSQSHTGGTAREHGEPHVTKQALRSRVGSCCAVRRPSRQRTASALARLADGRAARTGRTPGHAVVSIAGPDHREHTEAATRSRRRNAGVNLARAARWHRIAPITRSGARVTSGATPVLKGNAGIYRPVEEIRVDPGRKRRAPRATKQEQPEEQAARLEQTLATRSHSTTIKDCRQNDKRELVAFQFTVAPRPGAIMRL